MATADLARVDVPVIGAGNAAASAARQAREMGASVAMLETEGAGYRASAHPRALCHRRDRGRALLSQLRQRHGSGRRRGVGTHRRERGGKVFGP